MAPDTPTRSAVPGEAGARLYHGAVRLSRMAWTTYPEKEASREAQALATQVERDGGHVLAIYQDPVGEHWHLFALLPRYKVAASPYQRDLSPTHVKRLAEAVKRL